MEYPNVTNAMQRGNYRAQVGHLKFKARNSYSSLLLFCMILSKSVSTEKYFTVSDVPSEEGYMSEGQMTQVLKQFVI